MPMPMSAQIFVNTFVDTMHAIRGIIPIVRNIHMCVHARVHARVHACVYARTCVRACVHLRACMCESAHICLCIGVSMNAFILK